MATVSVPQELWDQIVDVLDDNFTAWEGEEDSVREEHDGLIIRLEEVSVELGKFKQTTDTSSDDSDMAIAIGEHAFKEGYGRGYSAGQSDADPMPDAAWSDYTPPEELCGQPL